MTKDSFGKSKKGQNRMTSNIKARIFLVGCPRSGTTLLQSFLAAHSDIHSFPESRFYKSLIYPGSLRTRLGIASKEVLPTLRNFLHDIDQEELISYIPKNPILISHYSDAFIKILDDLADRHDATFWLEKTPSHIQVIKHIEKLVPKAKFIHIIRNGEDVVASLYEVTHKYPDTWNGPRSIDQCIERWIHDFNISKSYASKTNHFLLRYEDLIENPFDTLRKICDFIGTDFHEDMIHNRSSESANLIRKREHWKNTVGGEIKKQSTRKFETIFDFNERLYISKKLSPHIFL